MDTEIVVISPHLDDAVFSCCQVLFERRATVISVCAGVPSPETPPSRFDSEAGFTSAAEAMTRRRAEDLAAAERIGFVAKHCDVLEISYGVGQPLAKAVARALAPVTDEIVLGPLGLRHPDHEVIAAAFRAVVGARQLNAWLYEELPYAYAWPQYLGPALALAQCGPETITRPTDHGKQVVLGDYPSQLIGVDEKALMAPERYHPLNGSAEL